VHGAYLILLDGISLGLGLNEVTAVEVRCACQRFLTVQLTPLLGDAAAAAALVASAALQNSNEAVAEAEADPAASATPRYTPQVGGEENVFGMAPFFVRRGDAPPPRGAEFELQAPSTTRNCTRLLRALQVLELSHRRPLHPKLNFAF
jgi:midasin